jgi:hypothetical protein
MSIPQDDPSGTARPAAGGTAAAAIGSSDWSGRTTRVYVELGTEEHPLLVRWGSWRPGAPGSGGTHESYALVGPDGPILIDPREPAADVADSLWSLLGRPPVATVLTNDWHERDAYAIRARWGTPVWAPRAGLPAHGGDLEGEPDHTYDETTTLPSGGRALKFTGRMPGDHLLLWPLDGQAAAGQPGPQGVLFTGDAISGRANPANPANAAHPRREPGLYLGAGTYYLTHPDPTALQASLRRAVDALPAQTGLICGAHGEPCRDRPAEALAALLDLDWSPFLTVAEGQQRRFPVVRL